MPSLTNKNAIAELVELLMRYNFTDDNDPEIVLKADLRIGNAELETEHVTFIVGANTLTLRVTLDGAEITPASRFGEPIKNNTVTTRTSTTNERKHKASISGKLGGSLEKRDASGSIGVDIGASGELSNEIKKERSEEIGELRVKAVSNDRWIISEPDGSILSDTYLNDEAICRLTRVKGANRAGITANILARQRDLTFKVEGKWLQALTLTQSEMFSILIAKSINGGDNAYKGYVNLSESEVEHEN